MILFKNVIHKNISFNATTKKLFSLISYHFFSSSSLCYSNSRSDFILCFIQPYNQLRSNLLWKMKWSHGFQFSLQFICQFLNCISFFFCSHSFNFSLISVSFCFYSRCKARSQKEWRQNVMLRKKNHFYSRSSFFVSGHTLYFAHILSLIEFVAMRYRVIAFAIRAYDFLLSHHKNY